MLSDKLQDMMASFSDNRDSHYRAQVAAVQADMNLIMRADPYANKPLEDGGEEAAELIASIMGNSVPSAPSAGTDYAAQVGTYYARFVEAVNDALEERDYNLTMLWNKHQATKAELDNTQQYKVYVANEEHRLLASTLRDRLIQSVTARRSRLLREKEQLDLADSNALLLHPNQFSITNPASPGGAQNHRKTRHTRHARDPDDLVSAAATAENKRKRKAFEDNDNDSPAPTGRNVELGMVSPFRDAKARVIHTQFEAAAFSIDRLFTEKELTMAMNNATLAAAHFFARMKNSDNNTTSHDPTTNGANGVAHDHTSDNEAGPSNSNNADVMDHDSDSPPGAPDMSRTISQSHHATRGATRTALSDLASAASRAYPFTTPMPVILPASLGNKPNAQAPAPPALSSQDVDQDMMIMLRDAPPDDPLNERLLSDAVAPLKTREYQYQPPGWQQPVPEITSNIRAVMPQLEIGVGGVPMSAQSSMGGYSDMGGMSGSGTGGVAVNRFGEGSSLGGVGMRRAASGTGNEDRGSGSGNGRRGGRRGANHG